MVYQYLREIEDAENDIKNAMQISSILLKHQVYDKELSKIDTNEGNISSNLSKISDNENSISNNLSKIDNISKFLLKSDKDFEKTYNIKSQRFEFDKENNYFTILEKEIEHDFIKNSLLFIKNNMYYKYDDLEDDYHRCQHEYNIYGDNNLIHKYLFNKDTYYNENSNILNTNEEFCIFLKQDYNKIKIILELHRHNRHGFGNIDLEIVDNNNYIKIEYIEQGFLDNSHLVNLNTGSINTNKSSISSNSGLINTNESSISTNSGLISTNTSSISNNTKLIETNESSISTNSGLISTNKGLIELNTSKLNNIENNLIEIDDVYNETFTIQNFTLSGRTALFYYKTINLNFTTNGIIKINAKYNYLENYNLTHIYRFYNNRSLFKEIKIENTSNVDIFEINSIDATAIDIGIHYDNNIDNKLIKLLSNSTIQINYINNIHKLDINRNNIESNLLKINENANKIDKMNKNIKSFYNLDQIFIYDIEKGYKNVDKDNHFHIFEKEITYNFTKNSYLEIALKVLTEISNYVFIGFFQILCNFYNQDNNLFYTISLSTAMGSINRLSTIKSVFIVPINEHMSKIKIDFFIAPKETQQNRSAKFTIQDINSNKIYLKYFQKTDEMNINNLLYYTDIEKKELLRFDNETTTNIRPLHANIHYKYIEYNFKKDDIIEFECKLILNHNLYDVIKNNLTLYFQLENDTDTLHNEVRDYIEFNPDRNSNVNIYIKFLYKFKFDDKISLRVYLDVIQDTRKSYLIVNLNENSYVSLKKLSL